MDLIPSVQRYTINGVQKQQLVTSGNQEIRFNGDKTLTMRDWTTGNSGLIVDLENLSMNVNLNGSTFDDMIIRSLASNIVYFQTYTNWIEVPQENDQFKFVFKSNPRMIIDEDKVSFIGSPTSQIQLVTNDLYPTLRFIHGGNTYDYSTQWFLNAAVKLLQIDTNTAGIAQNLYDIAVLDGRLDVLEPLVNGFEERITANEDDIVAHNTRISNNYNAILAMNSTLNSHTNTLNSHAATLGVHDLTLSSHTSTLSSHTSTLSTHTTAINENTGDIADHEDRIVTLEDATGTAVDQALRDITYTAAAIEDYYQYNTKSIDDRLYTFENVFEISSSYYIDINKGFNLLFGSTSSSRIYYDRVGFTVGTVKTDLYANKLILQKSTSDVYTIADLMEYFRNIDAVLPDHETRIVALETSALGQDDDLRTYVGYPEVLTDTLVNLVQANTANISTNSSNISTNTSAISALTTRVAAEEARVPTLAEINSAISTWAFSSTYLTNSVGIIKLGSSEYTQLKSTQLLLYNNATGYYGKYERELIELNKGATTSVSIAPLNIIMKKSGGYTDLQPGRLYLDTTTSSTINTLIDTTQMQINNGAAFNHMDFDSSVISRSGYINTNEYRYRDSSYSNSYYRSGFNPNISTIYPSVILASAYFTNKSYNSDVESSLTLNKIGATYPFANMKLTTSNATTALYKSSTQFIYSDPGQAIQFKCGVAESFLSAVDPYSLHHELSADGRIVNIRTRLKDGGYWPNLYMSGNNGSDAGDISYQNHDAIVFRFFYSGGWNNRGYISKYGSHNQLNFTGAHTCTIVDQDMSGFEVGCCVYLSGEVCNLEENGFWEALPIVRPDGTPKEFYGIYLEYIEGSKVDFKTGVFVNSVEKNDERIWIGAHGNCYARVWSGTYNAGDLLIPDGKYLVKLTEDQFNAFTPFEFAHIPRIKCLESKTVSEGEKLSIEL